MIEKTYYELSLEMKFKSNHLKGKLKQYWKIVQKYFAEHQVFKISEIEIKQLKRIERKVLKRDLDEHERNHCLLVFEDMAIVKAFIRETLKQFEEKENEQDNFALLKPEDQNRLLLYFYLLRRSVELKIDSKWSIPYLKYLLDRDIDTEWIPNAYHSMELDKLKKHLIRKGVKKETLEN